MSRTRLVALGTCTFTVAVLGSLAAWIAVLVGDLSSGPLYCDETVADANCGGDETGALILGGCLFGSILLFILVLVIRGISRPSGRKERWYLLGALLILPMPTISVLVPLVGTSPSTPATLMLGAMAAIGVLWTVVWCVAMDRLMRRASAAVDPAERYRSV